MNVKGADLLFLDHLDQEDLNEQDKKMWEAAKVNIKTYPFKRVIVYTPLAEDGVNRNSLRNNPKADIPEYSETREFALGMQDIWPYLDFFFDKRSDTMTNLLAEIAEHFRENNNETGFSFAQVVDLFEREINQTPLQPPWKEFSRGTIRAVAQRIRSLPATLGGLIDIIGKGFGLDQLTDLQPYDMIVVDIERIMANPRDPAVAESTIKIITAYVLKQITEVMTRGQCNVDHVIVFADELNQLAPRTGHSGIGDYLAQLARTTRDRGVVLFGAGQFRSGINEDILKAASVHYSMRTPEHEVDARIYSSLSPEFKARLTQLKPGEMFLQYPSLRTGVFAQFPRPFVFTGANRWRNLFSPVTRSFAECVAERLQRLPAAYPPQTNEVKQLINDTLQKVKPERAEATKKEIVALLRNIEMTIARKSSEASATGQPTPWEMFSHLVQEKLGQQISSSAIDRPVISATHFSEKDEEWQ
jgi:hypothetical protein